MNYKIIDMHCHVAGIGAGGSGCYISPGLRDNFRYGFYLRAFGVSGKELEKHGDALVFEKLAAKLEASSLVDAAVILALDGVIGEKGALDYQKTEIYIPNEFVAEQTARFDNLLFGASINPYRPEALAQLEWAAEQGAVLIKWLPSIQHIDPADERIIPFYRKLKELGLPLLTHTGHEHSFTRVCQEFADPKRLVLPLEEGVTVIAAHAGATGMNEGEDNMERLLVMFDVYPDLYADISSLTQLNKVGALATLLKHGDVHGRLLYGSDMPLINTLLVSPWYFPFSLSPARIFQLSRIANPWDRDVRLKQALGVPEDVFSRAAGILIL